MSTVVFPTRRGPEIRIARLKFGSLAYFWQA